MRDSRNLKVRIVTRQRVNLPNRIQLDGAGNDAHHIIQIKRLDLNHPFQRVSPQGILHNLFPYLDIQIAGQIVAYRRLDDDKGRYRDQKDGKERHT